MAGLNYETDEGFSGKSLYSSTYSSHCKSCFLSTQEKNDIVITVNHHLFHIHNPDHGSCKWNILEIEKRNLTPFESNSESRLLSMKYSWKAINTKIEIFLLF